MSADPKTTGLDPERDVNPTTTTRSIKDYLAQLATAYAARERAAEALAKAEREISLIMAELATRKLEVESDGC